MTQNKKVAVIFSSDYKKGMELRSILDCMDDVIITTKCKNELPWSVLKFAKEKGTDLFKYKEHELTDIKTQCYMLKDCAVIYDFSDIMSVFTC